MPRSSLLLATVPVALLLLAAAIPGASASPTVSPGTSVGLIPAEGTSTWAYGANYSASASWTNASGGYTASLTAFFGWQTILTQTDGSNGSIALEAQRTTALDYWLTFCKPNCNAPTVSGNLTYMAWETEDGFANLTTNGTVHVNLTTVPALSLENEALRVAGNETATVHGVAHGLLNTYTATYQFSLNASADLAISFSPALGLVPLEHSPGEVWSSTSLYAASGSWGAAFRYLHVPMSGMSQSANGSLNGAVGQSGSINLEGYDAGPVSLHGGLTTDAVTYTMVGPFHLHEGFLLIPSEADVFGSGGANWTSYGNDSGTAGTSAVDFGSSSAHLGLFASATAYSPQPTSPATIGGVSPGMSSLPTGASPALVPTDAPVNGGAVVQGQPESIAESQNQTACLLAGNCIGPTSSSPVHRLSGFVGVLVVGLLVGTLVAVAVVAGRRRSVPAPPSPNARLYPTAATRPAPGPSGPLPPPPPPEEDPLSHLW